MVVTRPDENPVNQEIQEEGDDLDLDLSDELWYSGVQHSAHAPKRKNVYYSFPVDKRAPRRPTRGWSRIHECR